MSGGVDSSVAAALLVEAGHRVVGFTLKLWDSEDEEQDQKVCCAAVMARDAARVCGILGIPHYTLDLRQQFRREVVEHFERDYMTGRTPNPCVHCNSRVKWGTMWDKARQLGLERIATGHYARIESASDGTTRLMRGSDLNKEQSYFLWEIPSHLLAVTILPLGDMTKSRVRAEARRLGLPVSEKGESQEVCFIPGDEYREWLLRRRPELTRGELAGEMVDASGTVLGRHSGYPLFTIGQRKGLGLGGGRKLYVTGIDPDTRRVRVGEEPDLDRSEFRVGEVNWLTDISPSMSLRAKRSNLTENRLLRRNAPRSDKEDLPDNVIDNLEVKIRYRDPGVPVRVSTDGNGGLKVTTRSPVRAVTPGQSAVFYRGDEVVAGGIIID